jgi:dienelactone hydrolase
MKKSIFFLVFVSALLCKAQSLDTLNYTVDGKPFRGFVAKPKTVNSKTKTILIVHEWWGLNEYPKMRAKQLAQSGFIAVCIDMYGAGIVVDDLKGASTLSGQVYADPKLMFARFMAGYNAALGVKGVVKTKIAAIGYCFGGNVVLNAAKMGAELDAVVSFHGGLAGAKIETGKLKAAVLVCNGNDDKFVPQSDIDSLSADMQKNNADYTFIGYAASLHAFTNPMSTETGKKLGIPIAYNEAADKKSYLDFLAFIKKKVN